MTTLAEKFQVLVNSGQITSSPDAPRFEPLYTTRHTGTRTFYNLGEAMIRDRVNDAKLDAGSGRNPDTRG
jgi:hypothetical protein